MAGEPRAACAEDFTVAYRVDLLPGHRFDTVGVSSLIACVEFGALVGDKTFDSNASIAELDEHSAKVVTCQQPAGPRTAPSIPKSTSDVT